MSPGEAPELWSVACEPLVPLDPLEPDDCACAMDVPNMAATIDTPSNAFNCLFIADLLMGVGVSLGTFTSAPIFH